MPSPAFFLYTRSNDLAASRRFYTELLGLEQIWDEGGDIAYLLGGSVQFSISYDARAPADTGWSHQPGWADTVNTEPFPQRAAASWSIPLPPDVFARVVDRLREADVTALRPEPSWVGYWSYVVQDPMGQTVELTDPESAGPEQDV